MLFIVAKIVCLKTTATAALIGKIHQIVKKSLFFSHNSWPSLRKKPVHLHTVSAFVYAIC